MMAQNRAEERSHVEAELDYAINMKAEEEIADIQKDLDLLRAENVALKAMLEEVLKLSSRFVERMCGIRQK